MKIVNPLLFFTLYSGLITAMKNQSYIELGVINSYSYVDGAQLDASGSIVTSFQSSLKLANIDISGYGNDGGTYFTDLMMQIAVKMINENPYILPNTTVILRRFNDMDPTRHISNNVSTVTTGFATITAMEIGKQKDLFGLVSAEYSSVLNYVGELTSVYKIPTCGLSQLSPRFSDKNLYPYFFRMISGMTGSRGLGNNYVKLFRSWNVNRVGIIVQQDVTYSYLGTYLLLIPFIHRLQSGDRHEKGVFNEWDSVTSRMQWSNRAQSSRHCMDRNMSKNSRYALHCYPGESRFRI
ncbi:hypothetical protein BCR33DRAFT_251515 [Rhizoclosmatium globosum]|uniref:Receptor ligand binding region domain-containing protein n=1 Tax=Rhizoclosmatium globosum TaxID=329046 RepID=A0A1Y2CA00_9FUNG|nr:hypothetical protein BCR33DRAFT_251515 [Rhizoclosmatium globosum]|eukprot:ORY43863.1 hypothetical protein BCR33DRAFT_251515 [Rhizoclosmatium globosum]